LGAINIFNIKCSFCNENIRKGDYIAVIGKRANALKYATSIANWFYFAEFENKKVYCQNCFNKQFKKK